MEVATAIDNCSLYSGSTTCYKCKEGYVLKDNKCEKEPFAYCDAVDSNGVCTSCRGSLTILRELTTDKKACVNVTSCSDSKFDDEGTTYYCKQCRLEKFNGSTYWATDVIGT